MYAYIKCPNGDTIRTKAYYKESVSNFKTRLLKSYEKYDCRIILNIMENYGFYIK